MKRKNCVVCRAVVSKETFLCLFSKISLLLSSQLNMIINYLSKVTWTLPFVDRWTQCRHTSFFLPYFFSFSKEGKSSTFLWCQNPFSFKLLFHAHWFCPPVWQKQFPVRIRWQFWSCIYNFIALPISLQDFF